MELLELIAYLGALLIGLVLGLLGGGGSILTVPLLVYGLALDPVIATAYSLFVVGASSLAGVIKHIKNQRIDFGAAALFAVPSFIAVYATRAWIIPAIPEELFTLGSFILTKDLTIMLFFAMVMLIASISMIRDQKINDQTIQSKRNYLLVILQALAIGLITGLVGAGGGFLIVPALIFVARVPVKKAIATSLFIIAINSLIGFMGDVRYLAIDWSFLLPFTAIAVIGIFIGIQLNSRINATRLKKGFGWFVLAMGVFIFIKEIIG